MQQNIKNVLNQLEWFEPMKIIIHVIIESLHL